MKLAIQNYKESSSFNNEFSKNNLGIIYKHGNENEGIPKNIGLSIEYFKEAIRKKDDMVSKYNLAHLYFYEGLINENIDKVIELLQESFMQGFDPSLILLCMAFIKKYGYNVIVIVSKTKNMKIGYSIFKKIGDLHGDLKYNYFLNLYRDIDYIYDYHFKYFVYSDINKSKKTTEKIIPSISKEFYEGFSLDI